MEVSPAAIPTPKSPPIGRSRHFAQVQLLEKEITSLQEELKSLDRLQPTSRSLKEVDEFVCSVADPLVNSEQSSHKPDDCCWTSIWGIPEWNCCRNSRRSTERQESSSRHQQDGKVGRSGCSRHLKWLCCANEDDRDCCHPPCRGENYCSCCNLKLSCLGCCGRLNPCPRRSVGSKGCTCC